MNYIVDLEWFVGTLKAKGMLHEDILHLIKKIRNEIYNKYEIGDKIKLDKEYIITNKEKKYLELEGYGRIDPIYLHPSICRI